jgi:phage terminase large subunit-like protein
VIEEDLPEVGRALPRLVTPYEAAGDYVASVEHFAERVYGISLMPWQKVTLAGQLSYATPEDRETGTLIHRSALTTSARQQGKSVALRILASWWAVQMAAIRKEPQTIMLVANEYQRAADLFMDIAGPMVELFGAKLMKSYQRQSLVFPDGTTIRSAAATAGKVGYSVDLLLIDEIWAITPQVVWGALKPSMLARRSPLMSCWSTAGDTGSEVMISMREGAINSIDKDERSPMFFAEWSAPSGSPISDRQFWPWSNPALGTTVSWEALEEAYKTIPSSEFIQQHLNMWQGSTQSWIPNIWHDLVSQVAMPPGGILAVDSSLDDQRYCGVRAVQHDGRVIVTTEFVVESQAQMWAEVNRVMQDRDVQLRVNPTIYPNVPPDFARRTQIVGYREMKTATPMVRSMIIEDKLRHTGENSLAEHVTRAVMVKLSEGAAPLSSQKSPGPIELARCMVWAAAEAGRPVRSSKAAFAFG